MRTDAPRGQTPVWRGPLTRDHRSALSALTPEGRLFLHRQDHSDTGRDVVRFVQHLVRHSAGTLLVIWDGSPIHRAQPVTDFLAHGAAPRLQLVRLPGDVPALHPAEGMGPYRTHVDLRTRCCQDLGDLRRALRAATTRLRRKRRVIAACVAHAGYAPLC